MTGGEVAPGVTRLTLPVGIHGIASVNVYLVTDASGDTLVDCGVSVGGSSGPPGRRNGTQALAAALAGQGGGFDRLARVVVTHGHVDHVGLAGEVVRRSGAELWMHRETRRDLATCENPDDTVARRVRMLADHGVHGEAAPEEVVYEDGTA